MIQKDKTQLLRLIFIDKKIREGMRFGNYANCTSMAAEYEVSTKSIQRDIDYLKNQCDAPIEYDASKKGYYYSEEHYQMPAININASDLFAIAIAQKALEQHRDTPIYEKLVSVFKRIEDSLPEKISVHPDWVDNRISIIEHQQTSIHTNTWETIASALEKNTTLSIAYKKPTDSRPRARKVDPYHLVNYQGEWYLIAFCHLKTKVLTFAVSRIDKASLTDSLFSPPADFDYSEHSASRFGIFSGSERFKVTIHFDKNHAPYIKERQWHPSQTIQINNDGSLVFTMTTSHLFDVKQWILSWGAGAKVIEPEPLRSEVVQELQRCLKNYR